MGFTGSRQGGLALLAIANARPEPIPVYAEMASINPVFLLSGALEERAEAIGQAFAASLTIGAGQFCTNPGLVLAEDGPGLQRFLDAARQALAAAPAQTMLTPASTRPSAKALPRCRPPLAWRPWSRARAPASAPTRPRQRCS